MNFLIHWQRPTAFWLLLLMPLIVILWQKRSSSGQWSKVVDEHLLPYILVKQATQKQTGWVLLALLTFFVFILALAGPAWQKTQMPLLKKDQPLVILLDLSPLMLAEDIKPSRVARTKYKMIDFLKARKEGQTGLVVFSDEPYVVSPLTQDAKTLMNFLPALSPELMPSAGQRLGLALSQAEKLIRHTGAKRGDILLITGGLIDGNQVKEQLQKMKELGVSTTIYAIGTTAGSPIPRPQGGFIKDKQGQIVMAKMDVEKLETLAQAGGGKFVKMTLGNQDISELTQAFNSEMPWQTNSEQANLNLTVWRDQGHWVILLLVPLVLMLFFGRGRESL